MQYITLAWCTGMCCRGMITSGILSGDGIGYHRGMITSGILSGDGIRCHRGCYQSSNGVIGSVRGNGHWITCMLQPYVVNLF